MYEERNESARLNLKDIQRDNYFGNASMPLGMTLTHRPTGHQVKGCGRPDNSRRDTGWKLYEELLRVLEAVVSQARFDAEDPEGVAARAKRDIEIMQAEVASRQLAIGKNPNDLLAQQERNQSQDRIRHLEDQIAALMLLVAQNVAPAAPFTGDAKAATTLHAKK